jgi:ArsR family transcriptional regulator
VDDESMAAIARALGHPVRVRILRLLAAQVECRGADVFSEIPLAQSTISEHLRVLREAGLISATPSGTSMVYCISESALVDLADELGGLIATHPRCEREVLT